jgi:para-aminobenzoate synthetase component I
MTDTFTEALLPVLPAKITSVYSETVPLRESFQDIVRHYAATDGTVALLSGGSLDCAQYNILGIQPRVIITAKGSICRVSNGHTFATITLDPFSLLDDIIQYYRLPLPDLPSPLCTGLLGYLAYDLKDHLEKLPRTSIDDLHLPSLYLTLPSLILVEDRFARTAVAYIPVFTDTPSESPAVLLEHFNATLSAPLETTGGNTARAERFDSSFTKTRYINAVNDIHRYIIEGDVYQVNISQRFQASFSGDPYDCFLNMFEENPAPFFAFINAGDHRILSTSPERFIRLQGREVETRPIKGTRPRGSDMADDALRKRELLDSPKDDAELSMIVDLLRNDLGKVCRTGSVKVTEHKRVEAYENVYHMVSVINSVLDEDKNGIDLIRATFPGGSITGCPKIRSMEIIDELEPVRRHVYTGSIGYISFHDTMDLSIAIRTATVKDATVYFSVGGGIVYDSLPEDEYEETLHKGRTLMRSNVHEDADRYSERPRMVWQNGTFKPASEALVSCSDEGFLYGYGFFETIRVENTRALMLDTHLERFYRAWDAFFGTIPPDITWEDIIIHLCKLNNLTGKTAACKILAAAGKPGDNRPGTLLVTMREYHHRLEGKTTGGLRLTVYPHQRQSPLASHKTMNYMIYKEAGTYAVQNGTDEAIILNPDDTVSETNTGNIFCLSGNTIRIPYSAHSLQGTVLTEMRRILSDPGYREETVPLTIDDLLCSDAVFVCNALMGVVPVVSINGAAVAPDLSFCRKVNKALFGHVLYHPGNSSQNTQFRSQNDVNT